MSFEEADKSINKMTGSSDQTKMTRANIEALKAVSKTIKSAEKAMVVMAANPINQNLYELKKIGERTSDGIDKLTSEMKEFRQSMGELNSNLKNFDDQATKLGSTANFLTWGLLIFAGIQALAMVAQALQSLGWIE